MEVRIVHPQFEELLVSQLAGRLTGEDADRLQKHLASCRTCRARQAELRAVSSAMDRPEIPGPSKRLEARLRASVAALDPVPERFRSLKLAILLAVLVMPPLFAYARLLLGFVGVPGITTLGAIEGLGSLLSYASLWPLIYWVGANAVAPATTLLAETNSMLQLVMPTWVATSAWLLTAAAGIGLVCLRNLIGRTPTQSHA